ALLVVQAVRSSALPRPAFSLQQQAHGVAFVVVERQQHFVAGSGVGRGQLAGLLVAFGGAGDRSCPRPAQRPRGGTVQRAGDRQAIAARLVRCGSERAPRGGDRRGTLVVVGRAVRVVRALRR